MNSPNTHQPPNEAGQHVREGLVFRHYTTLIGWGFLALAASGFNALTYGAIRLDVGPLHGPTLNERATLGLHLSLYGLLYASAALVFFRASREHPARPLTPWLLTAALAGLHLVAGVPLLAAALWAGGAPAVWPLLWLNPLTYLAAMPALLSATRPAALRDWWTGTAVALVTASVLLAGLAVVLHRVSF